MPHHVAPTNNQPSLRTAPTFRLRSRAGGRLTASKRSPCRRRPPAEATTALRTGPARFDEIKPLDEPRCSKGEDRDDLTDVERGQPRIRYRNISTKWHP